MMELVNWPLVTVLVVVGTVFLVYRDRKKKRQRRARQALHEGMKNSDGFEGFMAELEEDDRVRVTDEEGDS